MRPIPIKVNSKVFASTREAARHIVAEEEKRGYERREDTIVKELKRCYNKRGARVWKMYGLYEVATAED